MGKGPGGAELKIKIKLETFGGFGRVLAEVKLIEKRAIHQSESKKVVLEYEAPMIDLSKYPGTHPWGNRYEAEEKFKEIASFLERQVRERVFTN